MSAQPAGKAFGPGWGGALCDLLVSTVVALGRLMWGVLKRPVLAAAVGVFGVLTWLLGWHTSTALACYLLVVLVVWRFVHRGSFERLVGSWLRPMWLRWWLYERAWRHTVRLCGLHKVLPGLPDLHPRIRRVEVGSWMNVVEVQMLKGQQIADYERAAPELAHALGGLECRVRREGTARVRLGLVHGHPLEHVLAPLPIPDRADFVSGVDGALPAFLRDGVEVGVTETGEPWRMRLYETHWLFAGAMRSGKSSLIHALLRGLAPGIRAGTVRVWANDPKGGMELGPVRAVFDRYAYESVVAQVELLEALVVFMDNRARALEARGLRKHVVSVRDPYVVCIVDEVSTLTAYEPDKKLRDRALAAMAAVAARGGANGITFVATLQDPRMEVFKIRNLFPSRLVLRLDEEEQVDMVFGAGAVAQGARAHLIGQDEQGVGFVRLAGSPVPVKVRVAYSDDEAVGWLAAEYGRRVSGPGVKGSAVLRGDVVDLDTDEGTAAEIAAIRARLEGPAANGKQPVERS